MLEASVATKQMVGGRKLQQDRFRVRRVLAAHDPGTPLLFAGIADGMGGHTAGERAAELAMDSFWMDFARHATYDESALTRALHAANDALGRDLEASPQYRGMGTTFLGAVIARDELFWVSVGDSPLLLYRDRELHRVNADHSLAPLLDQMAANREITVEEALADPRRSALREALMGAELSLIDTGASFALQEDDGLLIASDGVMTLEPARIAWHLATLADASPQQVLDAAFAEIAATGGPNQDNTTAILVSLHGDSGRADI